jgi:hypothetical protein
MRELREVVDALAEKEMSRKQFLALVGGSFAGMIGGFQLLQMLNTPANRDDNLATSNREVFGEREYGHPEPEEIKRAAHQQAKTKRFDEDVFG